MNETQDELKKRYQEMPIRCERINVANKNIDEYLGSFAAEAEWNNNPDEAQKRFLNVNAYKKFKDTNYIGLIGRTGTGKTSIMKKVINDITNGNNESFKFAVEISLKDYIMEIPNYTDISSSMKSLAEVEKNIELYIKLSIMKYIVTNKKLFHNDICIKNIENYLDKKGIKQGTNIVRKILNTLSEVQNNSTLAMSVSTISKVTLSLTDEAYEQAEESMENILFSNPVLVMIDTLEHYDIKDEQLILITKSLVSVSFYYAWNFKKQNIFVKFAMPSEIYTKVKILLAAKFIGKVIYIEWNYKDLVKMLAVKFYCFAIKRPKFFQFINKYSLDDLYEDSQTAIKILYEFLPEMCPATIALKFDTLAYCIRHTQKRPRQLLLIVNALLDYILEKNNLNILKEDSDSVRYLIHSVQEEMIMDSIAMYRDSNQQLLQILTETILGKKYKFSAKELEAYIRTAKTKYKKNLDVEEIEKIFVESGIIGIMETERYVPENSQWFENDKVIKILDASFEYQKKGTLIYNLDSIMLIHPMCYEYFKCEISKYTMVYPDKDVDPDDFLYELFNNNQI